MKAAFTELREIGRALVRVLLTLALIALGVAFVAYAADAPLPKVERLPSGAYTALTPQAIAVTGTTPSFSAAAAAGNSCENTGREFIEVKNGSGSQIWVTVTTPALINGLAVADANVTVAATTGDKMIGPFEPSLFNDSAGLISVDYSAVGSVTVACLRLPRP